MQLYIFFLLLFVISITDTTPPSIECPESEVFYLSNGEFSANVTWPPIDATDDSGQVTVTTDMSEGLWYTGDYTVVATATDPAGNSADCSFNITIKGIDDPSELFRFFPYVFFFFVLLVFKKMAMKALYFIQNYK